MSPVDPRLELNLSGTTWTDVTGYLYTRDAITITGRGRSDEQGAALEPTRLSLTLDNRDGRFSPRNPLSPWYGLLGRNTPVRLSIAGGQTYLQTGGGLISTPDAAALDTTDLDIRVDATLDSWRAYTDLAGKYISAGDQRSWLFVIDNFGQPALYWSPDGTLASRVGHLTSALPASSRRLAVRATLDVDNGAGQYVVTFYTADSIAGPWTVHGTPITGTGTTSVYNSSAPLQIGDIAGSSYGDPAGRIHAVQLRASIGGAVVADPGITAQSAGATSWTGADGRTWTTSGAARLEDRDWRFWGEVSSWPTKWDRSGQDVHTPIEAAGITRRLGRGDEPLMSTLRRGTLGQSTLVAYWPCEDGESSASIASALGGPPMVIEIEQPDYASFDRFAASAPLPTLGNSQWYGAVPAYDTSNGQHQVRHLLYVEGGVNTERISTVYCSGGTIQRLALHYSTGGAMRIHLVGWGETVIADNLVAYDIDERLLRVSLEMTQAGADVNVRVAVLQVGAATGVQYSYTAAGQYVGRISGVGVNAGGGLSAGTASVGHIAVYRQTTSSYDLAEQLDAYEGETAGDRMTRLCAERGVPFQLRGDAAETQKVGPQRVDTFLNLIADCAEVDMGILYEPRDRLGLVYRTRADLYGQEAALELAYGADRELDALEPVDDDPATRNSVTVTREGGSSATAVLETGPLSVQPPPNGVGRYEDSVTLPLLSDDQLADQAGWRLHLGTTDEARYPTIPLNLRSSVYTTPAKVAAARALDLGDRLIVTDPPPQLPPDAIDQLVLGLAETITGDIHTAQANAAPYSPYQVALLDDAVLGRLDTAASTLAGAVGPSDTTLLVATTEGPEWIWEPADEFPFLIRVGGEVMQVTGVSGPTWTFEAAAAGWSATNGTLAHSTARAYSGTSSAQLTTTGSPTQTYARPTAAHRAYVTAGLSYTASVWAYHTAGWPAVNCAIDWQTAGGSYISTSSASKAVAAATWTQVTVTDTAPPTAARAAYGPTISGSPPATTAIWVDNVSFTPIEAQAFTVVRGVNGITKAHDLGADVRLDQPMILSF